jgi:nucleoside-diphosphate-sugar epimerase
MTLRAVIAGATGLIGSNLADHLISKGCPAESIILRKFRDDAHGKPVAPTTGSGVYRVCAIGSLFVNQCTCKKKVA